MTVLDRPFHTTRTGSRIICGSIWISGIQEEEAREWIAAQMAHLRLKILDKKAEDIKIGVSEITGTPASREVNHMMITEPLRMVVE